MPKGCEDIQFIDNIITGVITSIKLPKYIKKIIDMAKAAKWIKIQLIECKSEMLNMSGFYLAQAYLLSRKTETFCLYEINKLLLEVAALDKQYKKLIGKNK